MTVLTVLTVLLFLTVLTVLTDLSRNVEQGRLTSEKKRWVIAC